MLPLTSATSASDSPLLLEKGKSKKMLGGEEGCDSVLQEHRTLRFAPRIKTGSRDGSGPVALEIEEEGRQRRRGWALERRGPMGACSGRAAAAAKQCMDRAGGTVAGCQWRVGSPDCGRAETCDALLAAPRPVGLEARQQGMGMTARTTHGHDFCVQAVLGAVNGYLQPAFTSITVTKPKEQDVPRGGLCSLRTFAVHARTLTIYNDRHYSASGDLAASDVVKWIKVCKLSFPMT
jgi:hypothetical protein